MSIGNTFRRLARAFTAAGQSYRESKSNVQQTVETDAAVSSFFKPKSISWETSVEDEVVLCEASHPEARLIAAASLCEVVQIRVCQRDMKPEEFRAAFPMAYTYGPGGSERSGTDVSISFTSEDELIDVLQEDKEWEERRDPYFKRLPRFKTTETTFMWAIVKSKSRHFQYPAKP